MNLPRARQAPAAYAETFESHQATHWAARCAAALVDRLLERVAERRLLLEQAIRDANYRLKELQGSGSRRRRTWRR